MKKFTSTKKIYALALSLLIAVNLCACGNSSDTSSASKSDTASVAANSSSDESKIEKSDKITSSAQLTIDMTDVNNNYGKLPENLQSDEFVPLSGYPVENEECEITEGETALDLLLAATESKMITVNYLTAEETGYGTAYIKGINNINEGTMGDNSGWCFEVNGEIPMDGCDKVQLADGDKVRFFYVCDYNEYFADSTGVTE